MSWNAEPTVINTPPSKSHSHRLLMGAALADGESRLHNILESRDTLQTLDVLKACGADIRRVAPGEFMVRGINGAPCGGPDPAAPVLCDMHESGTSCRLLTAILAAGQGNFKIFGAPRLHERPLAGLAAVLTELGAQFTWLEKQGYPPTLLTARGLSGSRVTVPGHESSQYLSGLLMAAPLSATGLAICFDRESMQSWPYVLLTLRCLDQFGIGFSFTHDSSSPAASCITIQPGVYQAGEFTAEGDWSSVSYFLAAGALGPEPVTVKGLCADSVQGDKAILGILERMGALVYWVDGSLTVAPPEAGETLQGIEQDMGACPDLTPTVAVLAAMAQGPTRLFGAPHLRLKESDRISAPAAELRKVGCRVEEAPDGMTIYPPQRLQTASCFNTYNDHRLAMALSLFARRGLNVELDDPACVDKSFPEFMQLWGQLTIHHPRG